ncbi:MAG: glutaredoxin family protein [Acidiferrobacterales bacterium]|nr:glutaredoxin family protein [Acidiferrobacterales bacterium]
MDPKDISLILYVKENCGLCEEMLSEIKAFLDSQGTKQATSVDQSRLEIRDIEDSAEWYAQYREYVPTLVVNDQEVCHYFFNADELTEVLECPSHT